MDFTNVLGRRAHSRKAIEEFLKMRHCAHGAHLRPRLQSAAHKGVEIVAPMLVDLCVEIDADDRKASGYRIEPADATA